MAKKKKNKNIGEVSDNTVTLEEETIDYITEEEAESAYIYESEPIVEEEEVTVEQPVVEEVYISPKELAKKRIKEKIVYIKSDFKQPFGGKTGIVVSELGELLKVKTEDGLVVLHRKHVR